MPDAEMGKAVPVARAGPIKRRRRGQFRLPITVALCFVGLFLFFVVLSSSRGHSGGGQPSGEGRQRRGSGGGGVVAAGGAERKPDGQPRVFTYKVIKEFPHDPQAFTQGLQYDRLCDRDGGKKQEKCRDVLWESTGMHGRSSVREVDLKSGRVLRSKALPREDFGEGVTRHGDRLYQVTWMSPKTWSFGVADFEDARQEATPLADGWGVTSDGTHLVVGDSSERLTWVDPAAGMAQVRQVAVKDAGKPVPWLNELEWVEGQVWANVWHTDCLAQIDPATGEVAGWALLHGLRRRAEEAAAADAAAAGRPAARLDGEAVLNGVAWDAAQRRLFVTGKLWPRVFQLQLRELAGAEAAAALQRARRQCIVRGGAVGR